MRIVIEMGGGGKGEEPSRWMEVCPPDWVKIALLEGGSNNGGSVRKIYDDGSFSEWRIKVVK